MADEEKKKKKKAGFWVKAFRKGARKGFFGSRRQAVQAREDAERGREAMFK